MSPVVIFSHLEGTGHPKIKLENFPVIYQEKFFLLAFTELKEGVKIDQLKSVTCGGLGYITGRQTSLKYTPMANLESPVIQRHACLHQG